MNNTETAQRAARGPVALKTPTDLAPKGIAAIESELRQLLADDRTLYLDCPARGDRPALDLLAEMPHSKEGLGRHSDERSWEDPSEPAMRHVGRDVVDVREHEQRARERPGPSRDPPDQGCLTSEHVSRDAPTREHQHQRGED